MRSTSAMVKRHATSSILFHRSIAAFWPARAMVRSQAGASSSLSYSLATALVAGEAGDFLHDGFRPNSRSASAMIRSASSTRSTWLSRSSAATPSVLLALLEVLADDVGVSFVAFF